MKEVKSNTNQVSENKNVELVLHLLKNKKRIIRNPSRQEGFSTCFLVHQKKSTYEISRKCFLFNSGPSGT